MDLRGWCAAAAARQLSLVVVPELFSSPGAAPGHLPCSTTGNKECNVQGKTGIFVWRQTISYSDVFNPTCSTFLTPSSQKSSFRLNSALKESIAESQAKLHWTRPDDPEDSLGSSSRVIISAAPRKKHIRACDTPSYKLLSLTKSGHLWQQSHFDGTGRLFTILAGQITHYIRSNKAFHLLGTC